MFHFCLILEAAGMVGLAPDYFVRSGQVVLGLLTAVSHRLLNTGTSRSFPSNALLVNLLLLPVLFHQ